MKPIKFKQSEIEIAKNQDEYLNLPAHVDEDGIVTACWGMTWKERFSVLFSGKMFIQVMTFGGSLQPMKLDVNNPLE